MGLGLIGSIPKLPHGEVVTSDDEWMQLALAVGERAHGLTQSRPWVGAVLITAAGESFTGHTQPNAGSHAEAVVLEQAGHHARGATLYTTLEPCVHYGTNPPCTEAIIAAGVSRVVVGVADPDAHVSGQGLEALREAGIDVVVGVKAFDCSQQLRAYLHQRNTGRPFVVLKLATTLDGRLAAPDGTSKWITGDVSRRDVHRLRATSDAIVVGAGTIRADNPSLTARDVDDEFLEPQRIVLGSIPPESQVLPATEWQGGLSELLDDLGKQGCLQLLVEGGAEVAGQFHRADLVDEYHFYVAPALMGGDDGVPVMRGRGVSTMEDAWRGRVVRVEQLGEDVKIVVAPRSKDG